MPVKKNNLLIEIGTEELPPKSLKQFAEAFAENVKQKLIAAEFNFSEIKEFATPRRLALLVQQLDQQQTDRSIERRGPALRAAYDEHNKPTKALEGFLRSCNIIADQVEKLETAQGSWLIYRYQERGKTIQEFLPTVVNEALNELPIPKPMRWNNGDTQFVRPVHWIVMLYGKEIIKGKILDIQANRKTYGHRFHHPQAIVLPDANSYQKLLKNKGYVIVDFDERKKNIQDQIKTIAKRKNSQAIIPEELLDEVTSLVEWPKALLVNFDKEFLNVPREALISAMQDHQRCFALEDTQNNLLPHFITISNIVSKEPKEVIRGNERVMRARLADAKFFYETDRKHKLADQLENLKHVVFQAKLGSLYDKSLRVAELAKLIATTNGNNAEHAYRAGLLCKTDLLTNMVGEFPELQGIMGYYYALNDHEDKKVALAIRDHYKPRFAKDSLPETIEGCIVAIADRLDTLVNIFKIGQIPTGDKDPFGLRRAALGIIRILIEKEIDLDIYGAINFIATNCNSQPHPGEAFSNQVYKFILDRLYAWYAEQNTKADILDAVLKGSETKDFIAIHRRVIATQNFSQKNEAAALIEANKRVKNILNKTNFQLQQFVPQQIQTSLFTLEAEKKLYNALEQITKKNSHLLIPNTPTPSQESFSTLLIQLANLQPIVTHFFDNVLVMDENENLRNNRLQLLAKLRQLFLTVADISLLQG